MLQFAIPRIVPHLVSPIALLYLSLACLSSTQGKHSIIVAILVQEYLDAARKGGELGRTAGVPFKFLFYLHRDQADDKEIAADGKAAKLCCREKTRLT